MKKVFIIVFITCFFLFAEKGNAFAQADVHNTGIMFISTGTDVYIDNSFANTGTASLTNNGLLNVKLHVSNSQAAMPAGTGTLLLNGTAMQNINGSQPFKTYNLVTDNAAGFTLNNNLSVANLHTYTNGLITTSATPNYLIYEAGSSYSGSNDNNHVNGWVKKIGNTDFVFPVGNNQYERSIALSSLGASSEFDVNYYRALTPNNTSLFGALVLVDTSEYWTINRVSGSSAVVTMNWDDTKVPMPHVGLSDVRTAYWDGTFWRSFSGSTATGDVYAAGTVTSNSTTDFNTNFTMGSIAVVLPVQLINFTGQRKNTINELRWTVANEGGIKNYTLQRSDDGISFYNINTLPAIYASGNNSYFYNDAAFMPAKTYYRLKYTDVAGFAKYSAIIAIMPDQSADKNFYVIQNPVTSKIDFYAPQGYKGNYIYTLTATSGKVVQSGTVNITAAGVYSLPIRSLVAAGMYVLSLNNAQLSLQKTILKQ